MKGVISADAWSLVEESLNDLRDNAKALFEIVDLKWRADLLDEYKHVVQTAMGSVSARGGYLSISFQTAKGNTYWKNLAPWTVKKKASDVGFHFFEGEKDYYGPAFDLRLKIWKDTGDTRAAVQVHQGIQGKSFAGITSYQQPEFDKALGSELGLTTQQGRPIPQRKLFELANHLLIEAVRQALGEDGLGDSSGAQLLRSEIINVILARGWGKGSRARKGTMR